MQLPYPEHLIERKGSIRLTSFFKIVSFVKNIFSIFKAPCTSYIVQGGQQYRVFPFSKDSLPVLSKLGGGGSVFSLNEGKLPKEFKVYVGAAVIGCSSVVEGELASLASFGETRRLADLVNCV